MRFTVIGEALVDLVARRDDPSAFTAHAGGSPYNVAITLGRLGESVAFVGQCGGDGFGSVLTAKLRDSGVDLAAWRTLELPTSLAVATLDASSQARYGFYFEGTAGLCFDAGAIPPGDVLHVGSIASWHPSSAPVVQAQLASVRARGETLVSFDPNVRPALMPDHAAAVAEIEKCVASAHVVKASDEDVAWLYPDVPLPAVARRWCELGARLVVVTRGRDGAVGYGSAGELAAVPAPWITVADTVGAGDSFAGGLLAALAVRGLAHPAKLSSAVESRDAALVDALHVAVTVSAITCERPGADPPTRAELDARLRSS